MAGWKVEVDTVAVARVEAESKWRQWRPSVVPVSYLAVVALWLWRVWPAPGTIVAGGPGYEDTLQSIWSLAWLPHAITHLSNPLLTLLMNYPSGVNLMWNTSPLPLGLLGWPITALWGAVAAYNVLIVVAVAASAWAVFLVVRRWVKHATAAYVAGLAFLISPYISGQILGHLSLVAVPIVPLTLLWADWALVRGGRSPRSAGLILGGMLAVQFLISEEVAASLATMLVLGCLWLGLLYPRAVRVRLVRGLQVAVWSAGVLVVLVFVPLASQYLGSGVLHGPPMPPAQFSGRLLGFVIPGLTQFMSLPAGYHLVEGRYSNLVEFGTYLGLPLLSVVLVLAFLRWKLARVRFLTVMLGTTGLLVLGASLHVSGARTGIPLPGVVLEHIPVLAYLLPVRLSLYLDLFAVVLLGIAFDQALDSRRWSWGVFGVVLVLLSWAPVQQMVLVDKYPVPQYFAHPVRPAGQVLLVVPFAQSVGEATAMEWQATSGMSFAMVDGYYTRVSSNFGPLNHGPALNPLTWDLWTLEHGGYGPGPSIYRTFGFAPIAHWLGPRDRVIVHAEPLVTSSLLQFVGAYLAEHQVNAVVLGPCAHRAALDQFLTHVLGPSKRTEGVSIWRRPREGWAGLAAPAPQLAARSSEVAAGR
jgi:hypothetical protein